MGFYVSSADAPAFSIVTVSASGTVEAPQDGEVSQKIQKLFIPVLGDGLRRILLSYTPRVQ